MSDYIVLDPLCFINGGGSKLYMSQYFKHFAGYMEKGVLNIKFPDIVSSDGMIWDKILRDEIQKNSLLCLRAHILEHPTLQGEICSTLLTFQKSLRIWLCQLAW